MAFLRPGNFYFGPEESARCACEKNDTAPRKFSLLSPNSWDIMIHTITQWNARFATFILQSCRWPGSSGARQGGKKAWTNRGMERPPPLVITSREMKNCKHKQQSPVFTHKPRWPIAESSEVDP
jgi:hypothetical protein